jgi:hypothetical protein
VEAIHGQILNVGSDEQNYRVREIAEIVAAAVPGSTTSFGPPSPDNRSYRVSFAKIRSVLPGFRCAWNAEMGARELAAVFGRIGLDSSEFEGRGFTRLKQLTHLLDTGQLDTSLRWAAGRRSAAEATVGGTRA